MKTMAKKAIPILLVLLSMLAGCGRPGSVTVPDPEQLPE